MTRAVTVDDLELICRHREEMFRDAGKPEDLLFPMTETFREWLRPRLADGSYFGWIAEEDGLPVGGLGMIILVWPPHPLHPTDSRRAYILNVYVEPERRGRGIASLLMKLAEQESRALGISYLVLHATEAGRRVYEKLGWGPTTEMSLTI